MWAEIASGRRGRQLPRRPVRVSGEVLEAADDFLRALLVEGDAHQLLCGVNHLPVATVLEKGVAGPGGANSRHHREPPPDWEAAVARLARERSNELLRLADELMKR